MRALSVPTIDEVFHEVESGVADFGVTPVENSTEGVVAFQNRLSYLTDDTAPNGDLPRPWTTIAPKVGR
mgnify:CR=1 FL=1